MPIDDDPEIESSPLTAEIKCDGMTVRVEIYRIKGSADGWSLEVVDHNGTSTVWDDLFPTDRDAYAEFEQTLASDGIRSFSEDSPLRSVH
jgi:hypothetical protein